MMTNEKMKIIYKPKEKRIYKNSQTEIEVVISSLYNHIENYFINNENLIFNTIYSYIDLVYKYSLYELKNYEKIENLIKLSIKIIKKRINSYSNDVSHGQITIFDYLNQMSILKSKIDSFFGSFKNFHLNEDCFSMLNSIKDVFIENCLCEEVVLQIKKCIISDYSTDNLNLPLLNKKYNTAIEWINIKNRLDLKNLYSSIILYRNKSFVLKVFHEKETYQQNLKNKADDKENIALDSYSDYYSFIMNVYLLMEYELFIVKTLPFISVELVEEYDTSLKKEILNLNQSNENELFKMILFSVMNGRQVINLSIETMIVKVISNNKEIYSSFSINFELFMKDYIKNDVERNKAKYVMSKKTVEDGIFLIKNIVLLIKSLFLIKSLIFSNKHIFQVNEIIGNMINSIKELNLSYLISLYINSLLDNSNKNDNHSHSHNNDNTNVDNEINIELFYLVEFISFINNFNFEDLEKFLIKRIFTLKVNFKFESYFLKLLISKFGYRLVNSLNRILLDYEDTVNIRKKLPLSSSFFITFMSVYSINQNNSSYDLKENVYSHINNLFVNESLLTNISLYKEIYPKRIIHISQTLSYVELSVYTNKAIISCNSIIAQILLSIDSCLNKEISYIDLVNLLKISKLSESDFRLYLIHLINSKLVNKLSIVNAVNGVNENESFVNKNLSLNIDFIKTVQNERCLFFNHKKILLLDNNKNRLSQSQVENDDENEKKVIIRNSQYIVDCYLVKLIKKNKVYEQNMLVKDILSIRKFEYTFVLNRLNILVDKEIIYRKSNNKGRILYEYCE